MIPDPMTITPISQQIIENRSMLIGSFLYSITAPPGSVSLNSKKYSSFALRSLKEDAIISPTSPLVCSMGLASLVRVLPHPGGALFVVAFVRLCYNGGGRR